jgi:hypothetical protein
MRVPNAVSRLKIYYRKLWSFARLSYAESMLPILRILPVGGVLLAIMILVLALSPPGGLHPVLPPTNLPARGALMLMSEHPEWRQFLILAATRRADELSRLRDLPDSPARTGSPKNAPRVAGLPAERAAAEPDDETGSITGMPGMTIPIEIGETSSTELPVTAPEEKPPVIRTPERVKAPEESRKKKGVRQTRHAKSPSLAAAKPESAAQFSLVGPYIDGQQSKQPSAGGQQTYQPLTVRADPQ